MSDKKIAIIDCDDVIVNLKDHLLISLNEEFGRDYKPEEWVTYDLTELYEVDFDNILELFHKYDIIGSSKPFDYSLDAVNKLQEMGFECHLLTARGWHKNALELTQNSLEGWGFKMDEIHILPNGINKGQYLRLKGLGGDFFIDDNFEHARSVAMTNKVDKVYLRNESWNINECLKKFNNIERVDNLREAAEKIQEIELAKNIVHDYSAPAYKARPSKLKM